MLDHQLGQVCTPRRTEDEPLLRPEPFTWAPGSVNHDALVEPVRLMRPHPLRERHDGWDGAMAEFPASRGSRTHVENLAFESDLGLPVDLAFLDL